MTSRVKRLPPAEKPESPCDEGRIGSEGAVLQLTAEGPWTAPAWSSIVDDRRHNAQSLRVQATPRSPPRKPDEIYLGGVAAWNEPAFNTRRAGRAYNQRGRTRRHEWPTA